MQSVVERSDVEWIIDRGHMASKVEAAAVQIEIDSLYDKLYLSDRQHQRLLCLETLLESWKQETVESKFRKSVQQAQAARLMV